MFPSLERWASDYQFWPECLMIGIHSKAPAKLKSVFELHLE